MEFSTFSPVAPSFLDSYRGRGLHLLNPHTRASKTNDVKNIVNIPCNSSNTATVIIEIPAAAIKIESSH